MMAVARTQTKGRPGAPAGRAQRLSIRKLNKHFGQVHVVKDLSLDVEPGEFLVLLGPSGCGKTTALRMVAGLEAADSGQILLGETDVTAVLPKYRDVAMVFQSYALYPHKTVEENIGFPLKVRGVPPDQRAAAVREAAAQVHMDTLLERYPRQLSGGQRQRVALARAIVRRPACFLMDEPLSNLDAKLRGYMRAELKHMQHALGITTIYVTHDQIEAMTLAHRVAIMNHGALQQLGTPREVYSSPANMFVAGFMGSPPMNFVPGAIAGNRFEAGGGLSLPLTRQLPDGKAVLGFRPEDGQVGEPGKGWFDARVFAAELTGEYTLVTAVLGETTMAIKMPKEFDVDFDSTVSVRFPLDNGFLFAADGGQRLDVKLAQPGP
jgi:multiple sugar transport system ATP-binding protein